MNLMNEVVNQQLLKNAAGITKSGKEYKNFNVLHLLQNPGFCSK
ncbi:hypothetical protein ECRN5871_1855 [Escherichia coli RN587/1]|nr:hypothetical protein ECRN5871_1855 [Escherichia coli RN587/1]EII88077.1 hypothetical protein EC3003_4616 [Escherichia coli 3003]